MDNLVIFGASSGIAGSLVNSLKQAGHSLFLVGRSGQKLSQFGEQGFETCICNFESFDEAENAMAQAKEKLGSIDGVVNCAGSLILRPAHLVSREQWDETIMNNLTTAFSVVRAATKYMDSGSIVLCSTAAVRIGIKNHEVIAAAKGGVEGLVRAAAASYARKGIRVNGVAPGLTRTPLSERIVGNEASLKASEDMHALGRIGESEEVASAIEFLLNKKQSWVTGQILGVDGGLSSVLS